MGDSGNIYISMGDDKKLFAEIVRVGEKEGRFGRILLYVQVRISGSHSYAVAGVDLGVDLGLVEPVIVI